jgi:hypothetical protein
MEASDRIPNVVAVNDLAARAFIRSPWEVVSVGETPDLVLGPTTHEGVHSHGVRTLEPSWGGNAG